MVPGADPVHRVTIVPRGQALGVTYQRPQTDRYNYPEAYLRARIVGMLGGRAAEEIVYGTRTTGAENDIEQATKLARNMVTRWGMSDELGMVQLAPRAEPVPRRRGRGFGGDKPFSEETAQRDRRRGAAHHRREPRRRRSALLQRAPRASSTRWSRRCSQRETLDEQEILDADRAAAGAAAARAARGGDARAGGAPGLVCAHAGARPAGSALRGLSRGEAAPAQAERPLRSGRKPRMARPRGQARGRSCRTAR